MELSKHNIFSKISDSDNYFIINLLSGNADIVEPEKAKQILTGQITDIEEFTEKGYLVNPSDEVKIYRKKYFDFVDQRETDEIQIFFVPWYSCNFDCSYCYQSGYQNVNDIPDNQLIDSFFQYIKSTFGNRKKYITLFGGEPLLTGNSYKSKIEYFIQKCIENNIELAIVTNGYSIENYIDILKKPKIREIQVTLDGTKDIHNKRRFLKGNQPTFEKISDGIDLLLENQIPVNLRVVIDKENIDDLPFLARYAINKKWTKSPFFKTQLGRNYELHECQANNKRLFSRIGLYENIYQLLKTYPEISEFHRPAFSVVKFLADNGSLPETLFDSCPGCKTEWAFDFTGRIYSCTATVGKIDEALGTFYPQISINQNIIDQWQARDVLSIEQCKKCNLQLACGGGCASVAKNITGQINSPDCRPVKELLEMGISWYFMNKV